MINPIDIAEYDPLKVGEGGLRLAFCLFAWKQK